MSESFGGTTEGARPKRLVPENRMDPKRAMGLEPDPQLGKLMLYQLSYAREAAVWPFLGTCPSAGKKAKLGGAQGPPGVRRESENGRLSGGWRVAAE